MSSSRLGMSSLFEILAIKKPLRVFRRARTWAQPRELSRRAQRRTLRPTNGQVSSPNLRTIP